MSNTEDTFDESGSDGEESKSKAYEQLLSNPSYFSSAMKVGTAFQFFSPFYNMLSIIIARCAQEHD